MLKKSHPAKILKVNVLFPANRKRLIAQIVQLFEYQAADYLPQGHAGRADVGIQPAKLFLKILPVDTLGKQYQLVTRVDKVHKHGTKQLALFIFR
jgi:hypothetical protein